MAFTTWGCKPSLRVAACESLDWVSTLGLVGLTSKAMMVALGTESCSNSTSFGPSSTLNKVAPVILPPGRFRLVTSPICTGSAMVVKTTGIVAVAALAASAAGVLVAAITFTLRRTKSATSEDSRISALRPTNLYGHVMTFDVSATSSVGPSRRAARPAPAGRRARRINSAAKSGSACSMRVSTSASG